jgi:AcrR family transcriptional regulator
VGAPRTGTEFATEGPTENGTRRPGAGRTPQAPTRQRQRDRSDATVEDLVTAARALFAAEGYAATSLDAVCERAGVTKGALYHHFAGKQQLFGAVFTREQERLAETVGAAYLKLPGDPWEALYQGSRAYLEASLDPDVQRITLLDAPGALGWDAMRDLGVNCRGLIRRGVSRAKAAGVFPSRSAEPLTSILYGGLSESAMAVARSEDPKTALDDALTDLRRIFDALGNGG